MQVLVPSDVFLHSCAYQFVLGQSWKQVFWYSTVQQSGSSGANVERLSTETNQQIQAVKQQAAANSKAVGHLAIFRSSFVYKCNFRALRNMRPWFWFRHALCILDKSWCVPLLMSLDPPVSQKCAYDPMSPAITFLVAPPCIGMGTCAIGALHTAVHGDYCACASSVSAYQHTCSVNESIEPGVTRIALWPSHLCFFLYWFHLIVSNLL